jgi:lysosomal alpha-mannosidase
LEQNSDYVEFKFLVGPIPKEDKYVSRFTVFINSMSFRDPIAKEVITRFNSTDINSDGVVFTDSNGRQMMKRK